MSLIQAPKAMRQLKAFAPAEMRAEGAGEPNNLAGTAAREAAAPIEAKKLRRSMFTAGFGGVFSFSVEIPFVE
jgi:hypothetical protein